MGPDAALHPTGRRLTVFVAASPSALGQAKQLANALEEHPHLQVTREWRVGRSGGAPTLDNLIGVAERCDLAAIFYGGNGACRRRAPRDGTVFEAGLFLGRLGLDRDRVLLLTPLPPTSLPPKLASLRRIPIETAVESVVRAIEAQGPLRQPESDLCRVSGDELMMRERHSDYEGGKLHDDQEVYVVASQPLERIRRHAKVVRSNLDMGIRYHYFFRADNEDATMLAKLLRALVAGGSAHQSKEEVLDNLLALSKGFRVHLLPHEPPLEFCVHNASDSDDAACFIRRQRDTFFCWYRGAKAARVATDLSAQIRTPPWADRHIVRAAHAYDLDTPAGARLKRRIVDEICNRFDGKLTDRQVEGLCFGPSSEL